MQCNLNHLDISKTPNAVIFNVLDGQQLDKVKQILLRACNMDLYPSNCELTKKDQAEILSAPSTIPGRKIGL